MQFTTLASFTLLVAKVLGNDYPTSPAASPQYTSSSSNTCATITTTDQYGCPTPTLGCITLACLELKTVTQSCGCPSIYTTKTCQTACPTSCGATSYITAVVDCFPTHTPSPSNPSLPPTSYSNSTKTKTKTETEITTLTTCPHSTTCTGQTVTYTSTEVCPISTCTCVLPGGPNVTYTTTTPSPVETESSAPSAPPASTTPGNTPPAPTTNPSASPTLVESNVAGKWEISIGAGLLAGLIFAVLGLM